MRMIINIFALPALLFSCAATAAPFALNSPDIKPATPIAAKHVYEGFGCHGGNISPALTWQHAPAGTRSFAVTVYDPDAPTGSGWWHWVVFNLPPETTGIASGAGGLPASAVQSRTDYGKPGWGGPCPPSGDRPHRYVFTVYALKLEKIDLDADASAAMVGFMLNANMLGRASFTARYGR